MCLGYRLASQPAIARIDSTNQRRLLFARAFKAEIGLTPAEFRRNALNAQSVGLQACDSFEIGQSGREFG